MMGIMALSIPIIALLTLGMVLISRGPIGLAVARAIGGTAGESEADVAELRQELQQMRIEMGEMAERLDFAERLLAQPRASEHLRA